MISVFFICSHIFLFLCKKLFISIHVYFLVETRLPVICCYMYLKPCTFSSYFFEEKCVHSQQKSFICDAGFSLRLFSCNSHISWVPVKCETKNHTKPVISKCTNNGKKKLSIILVLLVLASKLKKCYVYHFL